MALGETDKLWWNAIIHWLSTGGKRQLVIFDYDEKYTTNSQFSWIRKENSIIDKLSKYSNTVIPESVRARIHIAVHKNIFEMKLVKK